jgi:hypothetical protein
MTKVEAARIIENFINSQIALPAKHRDINSKEEMALRKAVKALRRWQMNENNP